MSFTRLTVMKKVFSKMLNLLSPYERCFLDKVLHQSFLGHADFYTERFHSYWERLTSSWDQVPSPIRPSKGDCEIYQDYLGRKKGIERVLILGSTPEVRDLVAKLPKTKIYVADFSHQMLSGMLKFTRHADPTKEIWIKDDWLSLFLPERSFDVIIGDLVLQQISPENERAFLKKVNSLLKKDGIFISRFHFISERFQSKTIEEIVKKVEAKQRSSNEKVTLIRLWVWERFSDPESRKMDKRHFFIIRSLFYLYLLHNFFYGFALESFRNKMEARYENTILLEKRINFLKKYLFIFRRNLLKHEIADNNVK